MCQGEVIFFVKNLAGVVKELSLPSLFLSFTGLLDSGQTYLNVLYGPQGLYHEGNPLIRNFVEMTDLETGLFLPKIIATALAVGVAAVSFKEKKITIGKNILYGGGAYWAGGFLSNLYY